MTVRRLIPLVLTVGLAIGAVLAFTANTDVRKVELVQGGRSGFWTSREPASRGEYRWKLLGVGLVLVIVTGWGTLLLVDRAGRARRARDVVASDENVPTA